MTPAYDTTAATAVIQGWSVMAALIVAIGAQNALVLRQGLMRRHVAPVVALCVMSDWLLSAGGVFGFGATIAQSPTLVTVLRLGGAAFLAGYAIRSARRALTGSSAMNAAVPARNGLASTLANAAALTWLNPHVYLDTVVLLGAVGAQQPESLRAAFVGGAGLASLMWFVTLGYGAAALSPWLQRAAVWRAIDAAMALLMGLLALQLLLS